jgi:hypothetical protein
MSTSILSDHIKKKIECYAQYRRASSFGFPKPSYFESWKKGAVIAVQLA